MIDISHIVVKRPLMLKTMCSMDWLNRCAVNIEANTS